MEICQGTVKGNVVMLDEDACLPDGARVEVRVLSTPAEREAAFARVLADRAANAGLRVGMDEIIEEDRREREEHWDALLFRERTTGSAEDRTGSVPGAVQQPLGDDSTSPHTEEQLIRDLQSFEADHAWVHANLDTLLERYAEQWIAVKDAQVIASDPDLEGLIAKLPDPAHTCVEFVTCEPMEVLL